MNLKLKRKIALILAEFMPTLKCKLEYLHHRGRFPNLRNPKTWSEKLLWMNKYWQPEIKSICADKYAVRNYVKDKGLESILLPLLGTWTNAYDIDFDKLPNRFVLKANHGCAMNILCENKELLDKNLVIKELNEWLKIDLGKTSGEKHYHYIKPRIICEEFLPVKDISEIVDYKIHCFGGIPKFIGLCYGRANGHVKGLIYSTDWKRLYYLKDDDENDNINKPKPIVLDYMLEIAKILSASLPYVRVDLYAIKNQVFFGELTFTPDGNILDREYKSEIVKDLGKYLQLPNKIYRK